MHTIPTSSSWLNLMERCFRDLHAQATRLGDLHSAPSLTAAIKFRLGTNIYSPRAFVSTATVDESVAKTRGGPVPLQQWVRENRDTPLGPDSSALLEGVPSLAY